MQTASAAPATMRGIAACHLLSPVRSELQPANHITGSATRYGMAAIRLTFDTPNDESFSTIFGIHRLTPYVAVSPKKSVTPSRSTRGWPRACQAGTWEV